MANYKDGTYDKYYFCGGSNINLNFITCEDNIFIPTMIQSYVLNWYHMYLLHPGMGRMEAKIIQHLYWTGIRYDFQKEVTNFDTCQRTK